MRSPMVTFRLEDIAAEVEARVVMPDRGGYVARLKDDLRRYYNLLREELAGLRFTEAEACVLVNALRDVTYIPLYPKALRQVWANVADAWERQEQPLEISAVAWGSLDGQELIAKMRALTPGQMAAVLDAIERYFRQTERGVDALRAVGLTR